MRGLGSSQGSGFLWMVQCTQSISGFSSKVSTSFSRSATNSQGLEPSSPSAALTILMLCGCLLDLTSKSSHFSLSFPTSEFIRVTWHWRAVISSEWSEALFSSALIISSCEAVALSSVVMDVWISFLVVASPSLSSVQTVCMRASMEVHISFLIRLLEWLHFAG